MNFCLPDSNAAYCVVCGEFPSTLIFDGTAIGFAKKYDAKLFLPILAHPVDGVTVPKDQVVHLSSCRFIPVFPGHFRSLHDILFSPGAENSINYNEYILMYSHISKYSSHLAVLFALCFANNCQYDPSSPFHLLCKYLTSNSSATQLIPLSHHNAIENFLQPPHCWDTLQDTGIPQSCKFLCDVFVCFIGQELPDWLVRLTKAILTMNKNVRMHRHLPDPPFELNYVVYDSALQRPPPHEDGDAWPWSPLQELHFPS